MKKNLLKVLFLTLYMWVNVCAWGAGQRHQIFLELELQVIMCQLMCILRLQLWSSTCAVNHWATK